MKKVLIALACAVSMMAQAQTVEFWNKPQNSESPVMVKAAYKTAFANNELTVADVADYEVRIVQSLADCVWIKISVETYNGNQYSVEVADRNLGASAPEDPGLYFAWGEVVGYRAEANHSFTGTGDGSVSSGEYSRGGRYPYNSEINYLKKDLDPGNRMYLNPGEEIGIMTGFVANKLQEWAQSTEGNCVILTNGTTSIKFPKSGYFTDTNLTDGSVKVYMWASETKDVDSKKYPTCYYFDGTTLTLDKDSKSRYCGMPVRPVRMKMIPKY